MNDQKKDRKPPKTYTVAAEHKGKEDAEGTRPQYKRVGTIQVHDHNAGQAPIDARALIDSDPDLKDREVTQVHVFDAAGAKHTYPTMDSEYRADPKNAAAPISGLPNRVDLTDEG